MCLFDTAHMNINEPKLNTGLSLDTPRNKMRLVKSRMAYKPHVSVVRDGPPALSWGRSQPCDKNTADKTGGRESATLVSLSIWCSLFQLL
jgi:hypothetical protein